MSDAFNRAIKRDPRIHLPWSRAVHSVDGIPYLRPEIARLHKAHLSRPKDLADLAAARLDPDSRAWLLQTLDVIGQQEWAQRVRLTLAPAAEPRHAGG